MSEKQENQNVSTDSDLMVCPRCNRCDALHLIMVNGLFPKQDYTLGSCKFGVVTSKAYKGFDAETVVFAHQNDWPVNHDQVTIRFRCDACEQTSLLEIKDFGFGTTMKWIED